MVEDIVFDGRLFAVIVSHGYERPGVSFFTPGELSQQLGYMHHPAGHAIEPHVHNPVAREVTLTQETLIIRKGVLRVDFYDDDTSYLASRIVSAGDVVLLVAHSKDVAAAIDFFAEPHTKRD